MRYLVYATLIAISAFIISCKKEAIIKKTETEINIIPKPDTPKISLDIVNDSTITLKWSKFTNPGFKQYTIIQATRIFGENGFVYNNTQKVIKDADSTSYTITNIPRAPNAIFTVSTTYTDSSQIKNLSAYLTYSRKDAYLTTPVTDALIDKKANVIFLFNNELGTIQAYDYAANKPLKKLNLGIRLGYAATGVFGGKMEIYTPTADGWLYIIDGATLSVTDKIYVGGEAISSVAVAGDKIAVAATDRSVTYSYENNVKIYDRLSKKLIARTAYYDTTRLLYLEGTSSEFIDITFNIIPTQLTYFKINGEGKPITKFEDSYHGDHSLDPRILRSFPDGKHFITGASGTIYKSDLTFETNLLDYYIGNYSDYAFNQQGNMIYCAETAKKSISAISYPVKKNIQTYSTKLQPLKVFRDDDYLVCVTSENMTGYNDIVFIEKIKL